MENQSNFQLYASSKGYGQLYASGTKESLRFLWEFALKWEWLS